MIEVCKVIYSGTIFYNIKGTHIYHREDGPAVEKGGYKAWWINGKRHREDGPAVIYINGDLEWCLNGTFFDSKEEWFEALTESQKEKAIFSEYFIS